MDSLLAALDPLGELTDALAAEKHVTISVVCPLLTRLSQEIYKKKDTDSSLTAQMKQTVRVALEGDPQLNLLLDVWIYLDPQFQQAEPEPGVLEHLREECY